MKTSFARTFKDISEGKDPEDIVFKDRETKHQIHVSIDEAGENSRTILPEDIFVIESLVEGYQAANASRLLVNPELKVEFEEAIKDLNLKRSKLISALKKSSGLASKTENQLVEALSDDNENIDVVLGRFDRDARKEPDEAFRNIPYKIINNEKVSTFLNTGSSIQDINDYTNRYTSLINQSTFFKSGVFDHNNAETIATNLETNGFFEAGNKVLFPNVKDLKGVENKTQLVELINSEKEKIFEDPALVQTFNKLDDKLKKNAQLKELRALLSKKPHLVPLLSNLKSLKRKVWIEFLKDERPIYEEYLASLDSNGDKIRAIKNRANQETPQWISVIKEFNDRFSVPFELNISNLPSVTLLGAAPEIGFAYKDEITGDFKQIEESDLRRVLSKGEQRALYILNIIFEVKAKELNQQRTLFIVDDIADSFDYKNKYAIVQYLADMADTDGFYLIILTHNFDFYRTVKSRVQVWGDDKLIALRTPTAIQLKKETIGDNPFANWRTNLDNPSKFIATIPFARNLADILGKDDVSGKLTEALHIKSNSGNVDKQAILECFEAVLGEINNVEASDENIISFIIRIADDISRDDTENINLEDKITLSIAIRVLAEKAMVRIINDEEFIDSISTSQTGKLLRKIKKDNLTTPTTLATLTDVCLMTPENIHLNSFMFEPILDMSTIHLKRLFDKVRDLNDVESL